MTRLQHAMSAKTLSFSGAGLGLRRSLMHALLDLDASEAPDFLELAPENWIGLGGRFRKTLEALAERYPLVCHGLSLSIGSSAPLDVKLLQEIRTFLNHYHVRYYSEHLSFTSDDGHLYDLLPIPFTEEAVVYVAERIARAQDLLGRRIAMENPSYYCSLPSEMSESEFLCAVVAKADCDILLDVNNVYVNSVNHHYSPLDFLASLPAERIAYCHIAGHFRESETLCIDSHGAAVIDPVWQLLQKTFNEFGVKPTLLERDFNIPPLPDLLKELSLIRNYQQTPELVNRGIASGMVS